MYSCKLLGINLNLAIVDISSKNHSSLVENWIRVAQYNEWKVSLYVSHDVLNNIDPALVAEVKIYRFDGGNAKKFLDSIYEHYLNNNIEKIVITSLQSNYVAFLFSKLKRCNFLITIHNVNAWIGRCKKFPLKYFIKYIVRRLYLFSSSAVLVSSDNLVRALKDVGHVSKPISVMPFKMTNPHKNDIHKSLVVYPGMISSNRKKYDVFYELCKRNPLIVFVLLGKPSSFEDRVIVDRFSSLNNVVTFNDYVPKVDFNYYIDNAAIVFGDLNVTYRSDEYDETYGETKDSGLSYFSVENNIPLLVNSDFKNIENLAHATSYYDTCEEAQMHLDSLMAKKLHVPSSSLAEYSLAVIATRFSKF